MPYAIPDDSAPLVSTNPSQTSLKTPASTSRNMVDAERALVIPQQVEFLAAALTDLAPSIQARAAEAEASAVQAIENSQPYKILTQAAKAVRSIEMSADRQRADVAKNPDLSASGRQARYETIDADRATQQSQVAERVMSQQGDALLAAYPEPMPARMSDPAVAAMGSFIIASSDKLLPETYLDHAIGRLRMAIAAETGPAMKFESNQILYFVDRPILQRYAAAPTKPWGPFIQIAAELARIVGLHIDATFQTAQHRLAVERVATMRESFSWLIAMMRETGRWDDALLTGLTGSWFDTDVRNA